jgi:hypothetical protein
MSLRQGSTPSHTDATWLDLLERLETPIRRVGGWCEIDAKIPEDVNNKAEERPLLENVTKQSTKHRF